MDIKIICAFCSQSIQCDEGYRGKEIVCPNCQQTISIPEKPAFPKTALDLHNEAAAETNPIPQVHPDSFVKYPTALFFILVPSLILCLVIYGLCVHFSGTSKPSGNFFNIGNLVPDSLKQITANGTVYVKLNSGESLSLSMVKVAVYEDADISNKMALVNEYIGKEKKTTPAKLLQSGARIKMLLALNNGLDLWGGAVATGVTDKDGKFSITLPRTGHYSFFALTGRNAPAGPERYIFFRQANLDESFSTYTVDLNNDFEQVARYTDGWSDDVKKSFDDQSLLESVLAWIMTNQFGMQNMSPL